jgi:hypothetical protein
LDHLSDHHSFVELQMGSTYLAVQISMNAIGWAHATKSASINRAATNAIGRSDIFQLMHRIFLPFTYPGYKLTGGSKAEWMDKKMAHKCRALGANPLLLLTTRAAIRQYDIVSLGKGIQKLLFFTSPGHKQIPPFDQQARVSRRTRLLARQQNIGVVRC